jgi:hypothetical protein
MEPANKAKFSVDLTKRQMEQLDAKIAQQRKQIAEFQRMDNAALLLKAQQAFQKMQEMRARLGARLAAAQQQLSQASVDERSLEDVERNCPM